MLQIKDEPIEYSHNEVPFLPDTSFNNQFSLESILENSFEDIEFNLDPTTHATKLDFDLSIRDTQFSIESVFNRFSTTTHKFPLNKEIPQKQPEIKIHVSKPVINERRKIQQEIPQVQQQQRQSQKTAQKTTSAPAEPVAAPIFTCEFDRLKVNQEEQLLKHLCTLQGSDYYTNIDKNLRHALSRLRCKLNLRCLKRAKRLKLFDIDSYTNELIDSERCKLNENYESPQKQSTTTIIADNRSDKNDVEVIAVYRVYDRFSNPKRRQIYNQHSFVPLVEFRNDDVKCLISPYSNKLLKPYIRRDSETLPLKLKLHNELMQRLRYKNDDYDFERHSIDYVYLRPEHVFIINSLCKEHFWGGIDVTECLQYPDYTCVALYKKLIVGFAFMVPNSAFKEDYLSFIFVHPDWRLSGIAKYMLFHMATLNQTNDITLHVSVNSSAVLFYQKFGFKIEEYIKQFYDKYYCEQKHNLMSKDAFLMRLAR